MRRLATLADATAKMIERPVQRGAISVLAAVRVRCVHVPNGAHLSGTKLQRAKQMAALKADGLSAGFPDLILFDLMTPERIGFVEVKREDLERADRINGRSDDQERWAADLAAMGFPYGVIYLPEQALDVVRAWGWRA